MNKQRKTSHILNIFQYDETTGAVTLPSTLDLTAPASNDDSTKVPTTAWVRALASSLGYVTLSTDQSITGLKTIVRVGAAVDVLNFKIGTDTLYGLKIAYNQNELVESGEATWSFASTFNNGSGTGITTTPISFFRGVLVTGQRLLSSSVNANLLEYYGNNPSGRYPVYAYNTGVQQFASSIIVGETASVVNAATGAIADLPSGVVANFKGRVIGSNAVNSNEFVTLSQLTSGYVNGSGTTNYVSKFTASGSVGNSLIFDNGTTVLIGTTTAPTPVMGVSFPFSVTSSASTRIRIDSTQATPNAGVGLYANGVQKFSFAMFGATSDFTIYNDALLAASILVKGNTNNILIGTSTDNSSKLRVNGTGWFDNTLTATSFVRNGGAATEILAANGSVITAGTGITISGGTISSSVTGGVASFNTRTGAVTLSSGDVTTALGFTPISSYTETDTLATVTARGASTASGITFTAPGGTVLLKHAVSEVDAWIFQENAANWGIYWKNNPSGNHTFGGYTTVGAETFGMSAANSSGNGVLTSNFVGATSAYAQWMLSNYTGYIWSASTVFAAGDMRAPVFYDSNNTAYYIDGASTSNFNEVQFQNGKWYTVNNTSGNSTNMYIRPDGNNTYVWRHIYGGSGTGHGTGAGGYGIYNQTLSGDYSAIFDYAGFVTFPYSARSPIFYDSNNTGFYLDAAGNSRINTIYFDTFRNPSGNWILGQQSSTSFSLGSTGVNDTLILDVTNITQKSVVSLTDSSYFLGSPSYGFRFNDSISSINSLIVDNSGNSIAYSSHRAPIFFDSNNTNYYIDPSSTTSLRTVGSWRSDSAAWDGEFNGKIQYHSNSWYFQAAGDWLFRNSAGANVVSINQSGVITGSLNGNASTASSASLVNGTSGGAIQSWDIRTISPSSMTAYRLGFGFTSWNNNNGSPYADYLHLRSYSDGSGGNDNLITFLKSGIGMRIWQQSFGSGSAYSSYVDVLHSSNYSSYALPLSGGTLTGPLTIGTSVYSVIWNDGGGTYMENTGTNSSNRTIRLQAHNGSFSYTQLFVNGGGGYVEATNQMRAPIFYDSGNTAYYVDPASASRMNSITYDNLYFSGDTSYGFLGRNVYADTVNGRGSDPLELNYYDGGTVIIGAGGSKGLTAGTLTANGLIRVNGNTNLYLDYNYGQSIVGVYSSYRYQGVFAMGDAYKLAIDGTNTGSLYGIAWSHPNAGGAASNLGSHGMLILENGGFQGAWGGGSLRTPGSVYGTIFYDWNNTGYYLDPNSSSYLYSLVLSGAAYFRPQTWIQFDSSYGIYWPNNNGAHIYPNTTTSYTHIRLDGSRGGYGGIWDSYSSVAGIMYDSGGNGGVYREANGRWYFYYHLGNDCMGVGTSSTSSTYSLYLNKGIYAPSRIDATIYYDASNTGYYLDPNGGSYLASSIEIANGYFLSNGVGGSIRMSSAAGSFGGYFQFAQHAVIETIVGGYHVYVLSSNGNGVVKYDGAQSWSAHSDRRIKTIHSVMQNNLSKLESINPIYYSFNNFNDNTNRIGLIAQEVQEHFPDLVATDPKTDYLTLDYTGLIPVLLGAIKELKNKVEDLESRL